MKSVYSHIRLWFLASAILFCGTGLSDAKNKTLLIGVSEYMDPAWRRLSTNNDIVLLQQRLDGRFSISVCKDKDATHDGICKALSALRDSVHVGDTVFIHFSGHGQQMIAKDDTSEPDFLDEAIIPYDAFCKYNPGEYEGEKHLRDDELSSYVNDIRRRAGNKGFVIVCLDACHSGNSDKGSQDTPIRGTKDIFGEESLTNALSDEQKYNSSFVGIEKNGADVVYISACKPWDVNKEIRIDGIGYGSLSYSVAMALDHADMSDITQWLDYIYFEMKEDLGLAQTPMFNNSFGFEPSANKITAVDIIENIDDEYGNTEEDSHRLPYVVTGSIIIILAIGMALAYGKRKKRQH